MNGRQKGNSAERELAKKLQNWWEPFEKAEFVRTPLSGGWGGKDLRAGFRASGDIMTTSERWPFSVEVKRREGWAWKPFLNGKKSPVWGYWRQAAAQAKEMGGIPLLFFRRNREPWHVLLPFVPGYTIIPTQYLDMTWLPSELLESRIDYAGVLPALVTAESFFQTRPSEWTLVAPTFPKP